MPHDLIDKVPVKKTTDEHKPEEPPQYVIILHANPAVRDILTTMAMAHILMHHLNMPVAEAKPIVTSAQRSGRAVVKQCTKDLGETLMGLINECDAARASDDYSFKLELA